MHLARLRHCCDGVAYAALFCLPEVFELLLKVRNLLLFGIEAVNERRDLSLDQLCSARKLRILKRLRRHSVELRLRL